MGVNEEDLNNLNYIEINDAHDDLDSSSPTGLLISKSNFDNKIVLATIINNPIKMSAFYGRYDCYLYKISDDVFIMIEDTGHINPGPSNPAI